MKHAVVVTAKLTELVHQLPGVATLDWCDRAADAIASISPAAMAVAALLVLDREGFIVREEAVGCSRSTSGHPHLRASFRPGEWIGWPTTVAHRGGSEVSSFSAHNLAHRKQESPSARRWDSVHPAEVLLGAVVVPGEPGRVLVVELAVHASDVARNQVILETVMPLLGEKLGKAIGTEPADSRHWLTAREELVLWQLVAGKQVPQIAEELGRSVYTVHDHVKSLHRKLGATSRGQLVARALGHLGPLREREGATQSEDEEHAAGRRTRVPAHSA